MKPYQSVILFTCMILSLHFVGHINYTNSIVGFFVSSLPLDDIYSETFPCVRARYACKSCMIRFNKKKMYIFIIMMYKCQRQNVNIRIVLVGYSHTILNVYMYHVRVHVHADTQQYLHTWNTTTSPVIFSVRYSAFDELTQSKCNWKEATNEDKNSNNTIICIKQRSQFGFDEQ